MRRQAARGMQVPEGIPSDTPQVRPCRLGPRVVPRDGPREYLRYPLHACLGSITTAHTVAMQRSREPIARAHPLESCAGPNLRRISRGRSGGGVFDDRLEAGQPRASPQGWVNGVSEETRSAGPARSGMRQQSEGRA